MFPSDPPQNKVNGYHPNSYNESLTPNVLQYAEINDEFLESDSHSRKKSSVSCKQLGSTTPKEQSTVDSCPSYARLDTIFPSTYASLNETDADLHSPTANVNTNWKKNWCQLLFSKSYVIFWVVEGVSGNKMWNTETKLAMRNRSLDLVFCMLYFF